MTDGTGPVDPTSTQRNQEWDRARYRSLFESLQEAVVLIDNDGAVRELNGEFSLMFGYSREEALGKFIDDLIAPDGLEEEARNVTAEVISGRAQSFDTRRRRKDGSLLEVSLLASPVYVGDDIAGFYGIYRDISERKRAEAELRREKGCLEQLFQSGHEGIVMTENDGTIVRANLEFQRMFGYSDDELQGRNIDRTLAAPGSMDMARWLTDRAGRGTPVSMEVIRVRRDGGKLDVSLILSPVVVDGEQLAVFCIYRDITERKRLTERLALSRWRIEKLHGIASTLQKCATEEEVCGKTLQAAVEKLSLGPCSIHVVRKDMLEPLYLSDAGLKDGVRELRPGDGLSGRAFIEQETLLAEDGASEEETSSGKIFPPSVASPAGSFGVFTGYGSAPDNEQVSLLKMLLRHAAEAVERVRLHGELRKQAIHDPLTGLFNRNYFDRFIQIEVERSSRYSHTIGLIMLDLDDFKRVNDSFGHQAGDRVLRAVSDRLITTLRTSDSIIRWGGDEFLVILPENGQYSESVVGRIRAEVSGNPEITAITGQPVTLSVGTSSWVPGSGTSIDESIALADRRMYLDKKEGEG